MSVSSIQVSAPYDASWGDHPALRAKSAGNVSADVVGAGTQATVEAVFSAEALAHSRGDAEVAGQDSDTVATRDTGESSKTGRSTGSGESLTEAERREVEKLKVRDAAVRAHEAAHLAAGGSHVRGGASYSYQQGADGKQYAIGGEVGIDVSGVAGNAQATIQKMQQVRAAALAPADPSGADRGVAARAAQVEAQAREQLANENAGRITSAYAGAREPSLGGLVDASA